MLYEVITDPAELFPLINEQALFRGRWGYRRGKMGAGEYQELIEGSVRPLYQQLKERSIAEGWLRPKVSVITSYSIHYTKLYDDAIHYITGKRIVRVMARTRCLHSSRLEDHLVVLVELEGGLLGVVDCSKIGSARSGRFELIGDKGQLHGDQVLNQLEFIQGAVRTELACTGPVSTIVPLLEDWCQFLHGEGENPIPAEVGVAAVRVCAACLHSAAEGEWQEV